MLKVVFFARIREQLDCAALELPWDSALASLPALESALARRFGEPGARTFGEDNLIRAVNHEVVTGDAALQDGDEVAFYPPVTGG